MPFSAPSGISCTLRFFNKTAATGVWREASAHTATVISYLEGETLDETPTLAVFSSPDRTSSRRLKDRTYRPIFELLEDRTMLDFRRPAGRDRGRADAGDAVDGGDGHAVAVVFRGRGPEQPGHDHFTVYNQQADPETGVLLTDTLEPGVTLASASQQPDQSGQNLAWSLGTIQGYDRASVALTVNLPNASTLQLDTGAAAYAMLDAGAVSASTPAATLQPGNVSDPSLLASTLDADTNDPVIQEEAAALDYNPTQIFNFLHTQIGYNSYLGSVRGARGRSGRTRATRSTSPAWAWP